MKSVHTFSHRKTVIYLLVIFHVNFLVVQSRKTLFIGGMFSGSDVPIDSLQSVCENALELVNNRTDILPGYQLHLLANDTKCNEGYGTRVLFEYLLRRPPIIMILGAECSSVTRSVAQAAWQWNLPQVSYTPTAADTSSHNHYPLLHRLVPSQSTLNAARLNFFKLYKWKRIATLVQNDPELKQMMASLHNELIIQNFTIVASESFTTDPKGEIRALKKNDARIIVGMFKEDKARQVFCEAYKLGMYGVKYVWLLLDWFDDHAWWLKEDRHVDCTKDQMSRANNGYFSIENLNLVKNKPGLSGLTSQDITRRFRTTNKYAPFAFDSVWVIALTLHKAAQKLRLENKTLDSFTYENTEMAKIIQTSLEGLSFQGVTGHIKFSMEGDRIGPVRIKQLQNGVHLTVAVYDPILDSISQNNTDKVMWQGRGPPSDHQHPTYKTQYIAWPLFWFIIVITSCGILLAIFFLVFNIKYRLNSYIKLSSPCLNNVVITGALLIYASVYSIVLDGRILKSKVLPYMCSVTAFLLGIGYSLMFGAMFLKTWGVHQILNKVYPKRKIFKWHELIGLVVTLVVIDGIVFSLWTALDPFIVAVKPINREIHSTNSEPVYFQLEYCYSKHMITWYYVIFGYKGLLLLVGCFIAWETRGVKVRSLNDSSFIGTGIFTIALAVFIGVPLTFLIPEKRNAYVAILCLSLFLPTTVSLCLIFLSKVSKVKKHPGEFLQLKSLTAMRAAQEYSDRVEQSSNDDLNATIVRLQVDLTKVKKELRDQKALNKLARPVDKNRSNDESDLDTPRTSRKPLAIRSNTCLDIKDGPKPRQSLQHRRCNTFSAPHPSNNHVMDDGHVDDLRVENESLRQQLRQSKINEAGKMCKVLYENAELNRKIVELSMKQTPGSESDTVSRLMKENKELKRQLGEVSILNSVWCDMTPKLKRKGTTDSKHTKDLKELQHLLTVDLGGGRASSLGASRVRRPPTIGLSQSSLNLLDPKETHREVVGQSHGKEKNEAKEVVAVVSEEKQEKTGETTKLKGNEETKAMEKIGKELSNIPKALPPLKDGKVETKLDYNRNIQELSDEPSWQSADNQGFVDEEDTISVTKADTDTEVFAPEKSRKELECTSEKQFDKIRTAYSNTRELLRKGKVRLRSQTNYSTYDNDEHDYQLRRTVSADCNPSNTRFKQQSDPRSMPTGTRTVIGSDNDDSGLDSDKLSPQYHTKDSAQESTGNGEYPIERKQRKSKRDKKTKIERVEKTFFV